MSPHYLVKLGIRVLASERQNLKITQMFLSYFLENKADSNKVWWYMFSSLNLP